MKPLLAVWMISLFFAASLSAQSAQAGEYKVFVQDYVTFLNKTDPGLQLKAHSYDFNAYKELEILDLELERLQKNPAAGFQIPNNSLKELSCSKIVCGGGGGPCPTCFIQYQQP